MSEGLSTSSYSTFMKLEALLFNVKLLIIDKVSKVSNVILMKIHRRLREISVIPLPFGEYNIMMLGDLLQLPTVKASHVFTSKNEQINRIFGMVNSNVNLWETLEYRELLQNMRQGKG
ncbi:hypothetical protein CRE_06850 [Caenorhabditis remanei]|uniref:ATP-dependent DNA helicase n=1 Tax=Caenorhabditis remanei TaxID=31234 RepID=E3MZL1_CAERE|nr:hypothetical protein CRE_06850 [Caenorhabditis remanei]